MPEVLPQILGQDSGLRLERQVSEVPDHRVPWRVPASPDQAFPQAHPVNPDCNLYMRYRQGADRRSRINRLSSPMVTGWSASSTPAITAPAA